MIVQVQTGNRAILYRTEGDSSAEGNPARRPAVSSASVIEETACVDTGYSAVLFRHCVKRQAVASPVARLRKGSADENTGRIKHNKNVNGCAFIIKFIVDNAVSVFIGEELAFRER